jgi:hypothetical protein
MRVFEKSPLFFFLEFFLKVSPKVRLAYHLGLSILKVLLGRRSYQRIATMAYGDWRLGSRYSERFLRSRVCPLRSLGPWPCQTACGDQRARHSA